MPKIITHEWQERGPMKTLRGVLVNPRTWSYIGHMPNKQRAVHATLILDPDGTFVVYPPRRKARVVDDLFQALALLASRGVPAPEGTMIQNILAEQAKLTGG
jgi:hypothetical protein